jgi:ADP-heptose:LPS heptosyltransferase
MDPLCPSLATWHHGSLPGAVDGSALKVPPLHVQERWRNDLVALLGRQLVLIQAGNRRTTRWMRRRNRPSNTKYWPEERWASVVDAIARAELDAEILLTGVPREARLNDAILYMSSTNRAHNAAHDLPLHRLLALQQRAIGMVSVDTGPAHSAAALGCPLVVLFGTADPDMYAPRSLNDSVICLQGCKHGRASMLGISVDHVVDAWDALRSARSDRRVLSMSERSAR